MAVFPGVRSTPCFSDLFLTLLFELVKGVCGIDAAASLGTVSSIDMAGSIERKYEFRVEGRHNGGEQTYFS